MASYDVAGSTCQTLEAGDAAQIRVVHLLHAALVHGRALLLLLSPISAELKSTG